MPVLSFLTKYSIREFAVANDGAQVSVDYTIANDKGKDVNLSLKGHLRRINDTWVVKSNRGVTIDLENDRIRDINTLRPSTSREEDDVAETRKKAHRADTNIIDDAAATTTDTRPKKPTKPRHEVIDDDSSSSDDETTLRRNYREQKRRIRELEMQRIRELEESTAFARAAAAEANARAAAAEATAAALARQQQATSAHPTPTAQSTTTRDDISLLAAHGANERLVTAIEKLEREHNCYYVVIIDKRLCVVAKVEDATVRFFCPIHTVLEISQHEPPRLRPIDEVKREFATRRGQMIDKANAIASEAIVKNKLDPKHLVHTVLAEVRAFKMSLDHYAKLLDPFIDAAQTALPATRAGWDDILGAAVMALATYRTMVANFADCGAWTLHNWSFMYDHQHFNINMLATSKALKK
jgi:hypothetical protein